MFLQCVTSEVSEPFFNSLSAYIQKNISIVIDKVQSYAVILQNLFTTYNE